MSWADLFERAEEYETDEETIRETLEAHRNAHTEEDEQASEGTEDA